ncbi:hypothetical protein AB1Y20_020317 [Prymnesium parvum]|uniref:Non-specific serine/threonine protein kinase n=1 Tax=Prymnesium parvum TaxID=97485 RepID=A0AB34JXT8_PRYPA
MTLSTLHELLCEASPPIVELKELLQKHRDELLRTLERFPTADQPGGAGTVKPPLFAAPPSNAVPPADPCEAHASTLTQMDEHAVRRLLNDFHQEAFNDYSAFREACHKPQLAPVTVAPVPAPAAPAPAAASLFGKADASPPVESTPSGPSAAEYLAPLPAEAQLLQFAHEQRLLLLRCIRQMLAIVYQDSGASLRNIVCGSVALLLQGDLPRRVLDILLDETHTPPVESRLPKRLLGAQVATSSASLRAGMRMEVLNGSSWCVATLVEKSSADAWTVKFDEGALAPAVPVDRMRATSTALLVAKAHWLKAVGDMVESHAIAERLALHELLLLLRYLPLHAQAAPETIKLLDDLLLSWPNVSKPSRSSLEASPENLGFYALFAGTDSSVLPKLVTLLEASIHQALLINSHHDHTASPALRRRTTARSAMLQRCSRLATLIVLTSMFAEKEYCQGHTSWSRTERAAGRHEEFIASLHSLALYLMQSASYSRREEAAAVGVTMLAACVLVLETAPLSNVANVAGDLAVKADQLGGLDWGRMLLRVDGFRQDDCDEVASISRQLLFDLVTGLVSQARFAGAMDDSPSAKAVGGTRVPLEADSGWPAHSAPLHALLVDVLSGQPSLCSTFWDLIDDARADPRVSSPLLSLIAGTRYPLFPDRLPLLLAAAAADVEADGLPDGEPANSERSMAFARAFPFVCHCVPQHFTGFGKRLYIGQRYLTETPLQALGTPSITLPANSSGEWVEQAGDDLVVEWRCPPNNCFNTLPRMLSSIEALLALGPAASPRAQQEAWASLNFFVATADAFIRDEGSLASLPDVLPPVSWLSSLLSLCSKLESRPLGYPPASSPHSSMESPEVSLEELTLKLLAIEATVVPLEVLSAMQGSAVLDPGPWMSQPRPLARSTTLATLAMIEGVVSGVACSGGTDGELPPLPISLAPALQYTVEWALPLIFLKDDDLSAFHGRGESGTEIEGARIDFDRFQLPLRVFSLLDKVLDHEGAAAAALSSNNGVGQSVPPRTLLDIMLPHLIDRESSALAIIEAIESASTTLFAQAEHRKGRSTSAPGAEVSIRAALSCALAFLLRLLHASHGRAQGCVLHRVLLSSSKPTDGFLHGPTAKQPCAVRQLGLCMLLHDEVLSQSPAYSDSTWARDAGTELHAVGPTAARCLALLCHAVPSASVSVSPLVIGIGPIAASLSSLLSRWVEAVMEDDAVAEVVAEAGGVADCAAAALQLLGGAAESQPELFRNLCRGGFREGDTVRVRRECSTPNDGWGAISRDSSGTVHEVKPSGGMILHFPGSGLWQCSVPSSLELCPPRLATDSKWQEWSDLKEKLKHEGGKGDDSNSSETLERTQFYDISQTFGSSNNSATLSETPLVALLRLIELDESEGGKLGQASNDTNDEQDGSPKSRTSGVLPKVCQRELLALRSLALSTIMQLLRKPILHSTSLHMVRTRSTFWDALPKIIASTPGADVNNMDEEIAHRWLATSCALELLAIELRRATPPRPLLPAVGDAFGATLCWLASEPMTDAPINPPVDQLVELLGVQVEGLERRVAEVEQLSRMLGCGSAISTFRPPIECHRLSGALRRQLHERSLLRDERLPPRQLPLIWSGGSTSCLALASPLFDIEMMLLRASKLDASAAVRSTNEARRAAERLNSTEARVNAALAAALEDAQSGDKHAAVEAASLIERLPDALERTQLGSSTLSNLERNRAVQNRRTLISIAMASNHAIMCSAAHSSAVRGWKAFLAALLEHGHVARPLVPLKHSAAAGARAPAWLAATNSGDSLDSKLVARAKELATSEREWADACTAAVQLRAQAELAGAACELLRQQALALCGARGALAWTIVDHLLDTPAWQQRLREGKLGRGKDGSLPPAKLAVQVLEQRGSLDTRPSTRPGAADNFSSQRDARLLVLHAALDDTHQLLHRSDVTPGWQLLHKLTTSLRHRLDAARASAGAAALPAAAVRVLESAASALRQNDAQLRKLGRGEASAPPDASIECLPLQLAKTACELNEKAALLVGLQSSRHQPAGCIPVVGARAAHAAQLLDSDAECGKASGAPANSSPRASPRGSASFAMVGCSSPRSSWCAPAAASANAAQTNSSTRSAASRFSARDDTMGAVQLLSQLSASPPATAAGASRFMARRNAMEGALDRLAQARQWLLFQAADLRQSSSPTKSGRSNASTCADRVALLRSLQRAMTSCGVKGESEQWTSQASDLVDRVIAGLSVEMHEVAQQIAVLEASASRLITTQLPHMLLGEEISACTIGLGEYHCQMSKLSDLRSTRAKLDARARASDALAALLRELSACSSVSPSSSPANEAVTALAAALDALPLKQSGIALPPIGSDPQTFVAAAVNALLACETDVSSSNDSHLSASRLVDALDARAARLHELMTVVALAFAHEDKAQHKGTTGGYSATASTLEVRLLGDGDERTFVLSGGGVEGTRVLHPNGWFVDEQGNFLHRASQNLCTVLWPERDRQPRHFYACCGSSSKEQCTNAIRALTLSLASRLARRAKSVQTNDLKALSTMLLTSLQLLLGGNATSWLPEMPTPAGLCVDGTRARTRDGPVLDVPTCRQLMSQVADAISLLPPPQPNALLPDTLLSVLLELERAHRQAGPGHEALLASLVQPLVPRLCVGLTSLSAATAAALAATASPQDAAVVQTRLHRSATLHICLLGAAAVAPGPLELSVGMTAEGYLVGLLQPGRPQQMLPLLGAIESLARVPRRAAALLAAGILQRLCGLIPDRGMQLRLYDEQGRHCAQHEVWLRTLAIATAALRSASGSSAQAALAHAATFVNLFLARLRAACAGERSAVGLHEQCYAIRLIEAIVQVNENDGTDQIAFDAPKHLLAELAILSLASASKMMLLRPTELQAEVVPRSPEERAASLRLPSGDLSICSELCRPRTEQSRSRSAQTMTHRRGLLHCGTIYSQWILSALQGSLCAALKTLCTFNKPPPLDDNLVETMQCALKASFTTLQRLGPQPFGFTARSLSLAATQCVALFGGLAIQAGMTQMRQLQSVQRLALSQVRARQQEDPTTAIQAQLLDCARELRRLPQALHLWVDTAIQDIALQEDSVCDSDVRRKIAAVIGGDIEATARLVSAEAERSASMSRPSQLLTM